MRDVAIREPGGTTRTASLSVTARILPIAAGDLVVRPRDRPWPPAQTFIWRSTRRNAASSGDSGAVISTRLVGQRHGRDVLLVDQQPGRVGDLGDLIDL